MCVRIQTCNANRTKILIVRVWKLYFLVSHNNCKWKDKKESCKWSSVFRLVSAMGIGMVVELSHDGSRVSIVTASSIWILLYLIPSYPNKKYALLCLLNHSSKPQLIISLIIMCLFCCCFFSKREWIRIHHDRWHVGRVALGYCAEDKANCLTWPPQKGGPPCRERLQIMTERGPRGGERTGVFWWGIRPS